MKFLRTAGISLLATMLTLTACEPEPDSFDLVKDMLVQTGYDKTAGFSSYVTFSMPMDTLGYLYNLDPTDTIITGSYATQVTEKIRSHFLTAGYTKVPRSLDPDLGVNVFVVRDYSVFQSVIYPSYFSGYPGYYYLGYYGYGGYYGYPYVNYSSMDTATLVIELIDLKNKDSLGRVKVIWTAYMGDLLNTVNLEQKTIEAIDQSFAQSTYIKK